MLGGDTDPYADLVSEVREALSRGKHVQQTCAQKGIVNEANIAALHDACEAAAELLVLLQQAMQIVTDRGGKVHGKVFTANDILARQTTVRALEDELAELQCFCRDVVSRRQGSDRIAADVTVALSVPAAVEATADVTSRSWHEYNNTGDKPDNVVVSQEHMQRQEQLQQDEVLDRLTYGLAELREAGVGINSELTVQHTVLSNVERGVSGVQVRLRAANERVDRLLRSMTNRGKLCTIVALMIVLVVLLILTFH